MADDDTRPAMAPDYPVETERLLLRPIDPVGDIDAMHAYRSREDVCRYIPPVPVTREQLAATYADPERSRSVLTEAGQILALAIVLRETGRFVGDIILIWSKDHPSNGEVGYIVDPEHQGRGYATEAVRAVLALAFDGFGLHRVVGRIDARNPASGRVLTKAGMRQEAVLVENEWFKGEWGTEVDFAILEREWRAQRA
ncbi:GNAT family protein [Amnibacterium soli]|uniref:GNAT family protein n=1 Tax=Amnibacterium soli TaxID=1282736 RepID=A0ABP8YRK0_9MICO